MRWFDKLRNNTLGLICILALIAFHLDDAINGKFLFPLNNWLHSFKLSTISMDSEDHEWWHFQFPATQGEGKELEPAHQWLSWVGLHIRAQCNETRQRWVNYSHDGRRFYYLRDEFDFQYERKSPQVEKVYKEIIELMHQVVEKSGATLVVAPMPTKTSIYRDRLPQSLQEQKLWQPYRNHRNMKEDSYLVYQGALKGAPSDTVDVYRAFKNYHSEHPQDDLYIPSNHEWSSLGIALTAAEVVKNLQHRGWKLADPQVTKIPVEGELYDGSTLEIVNLPHSFAPLYPQAQLHEPLYGISRVSSRVQKGRLFVFGTCYSSRMRESYGFGRVLSYALNRPNEINLANEGGATIPSFQRFVKEYRHFKPGDLIVWEFNLREIFRPDQLLELRDALRIMASEK